MLYYMNSKDFSKVFLNNEDDKDILKCWYVLVSYRIRHGGKRPNVMSYSGLFPNSNILVNSNNIDEFRNLYYSQLNEYKSSLGALVKLSLTKHENIIFMCSENEYRIGYLKILADYIYDKFDYPVYNYVDYVNCKCELAKINKDKVMKKCKKVIIKNPFSNMSNSDIESFIRKNRKKTIKFLEQFGFTKDDFEDADDDELLVLVKRNANFYG